MAGEKVRTDWDSMRTADPKVFAAGDGAFGPSTIVTAMYHGHRARTTSRPTSRASRSPLPYRTPYKTRRVPVAQDALWEVFAREHQEFHGLGANPVAFPEIESTYDAEAAKREAARCYRCDAETGSADYSVRTREDIFVMARTKPEDARKQRALFTRRLPSRTALRPAGRRRSTTSSSCRRTSRASSSTRIATPAAFDRARSRWSWPPFLAAGFDDAPDEVRAAVAHGLAGAGARLRRPPAARPPTCPGSSSSPDGDDAPTRGAAVIRVSRRFDAPAGSADDQLLGLGPRITSSRGGDPLRARARVRPAPAGGRPARWQASLPELAGAPDLSVLRDAIKILRR